ncbi:MAG: tetratricopeptide repeat protein [Thermodesulfobacteriota bacterium]|nr:tetratricopeptide repeat protein [Thermodesulfobacteriota bacterium]
MARKGPVRITAILMAALLLPGILHAEIRGPDSRPARARLAIARVTPLMQNENYQQAAEILKDYQARKQPATETDDSGYHHPAVYFTLGNCYLMMAHYEQAAAAYQKAVIRDPSHTRAWLNRARALYEMKQMTAAGRCFEKAYDTADKKTPEPLYYSAVAHLMAGDPAQAVALFERLMAAHPSAMQPEWKENLVHALLGDNRFERALPYIRELVDGYTGEKKMQWQAVLLHQYIQLGMEQAALDLALLLTRETPEVDRWWKSLAYIHLNAGRYEAALAALIPYGFLTSLSREEKQLIADLSLEVGIPVKAASVYEKCLEEKPDKKMLRRLVLAYRQLGQPEKALERIRAFNHTPEDADLILLAAQLHYVLEQYGQAADDYRRAARKPGNHRGRAWLMAGYSAWQAGNFSAARDALLQAKTYPQQREAAQKALCEIE